MKTRCAALVLLSAALFAQPRRIVSTAPSITELLYALDLGDRVVGVTRYCLYPPEAQKKPKIGGFSDPNLEAIAALKPDLVVIQTNPVHLAEHLRAMHLDVLEIDQQDIPAIYESIRSVGNATGTEDQAAKLIQSIRGGLDSIRARTAHRPHTPMMLVVGRTPGRLDGLVVVGKASYLNEVIEIAGGENVFRDARAAYPEVSLEEVLARKPEVIVDMGDMGDHVAVTEEERRSVVALWQRLPSVPAVRDHRVFPIATDGFLVPGPRVGIAARTLLEMIHPESK